MKLRVFVLLALVGSVGCKASVSANVNTGAKADEDVADFDRPMDEPVTGGSSLEETLAEPALLGARADLAYKGPLTPACRCLAVAVGQPGETKFEWAGERPRISSSRQLIVALTSGGVDCPDGGDKQKGASYFGHEVDGNDVVVIVENASPGRPVATGGVIPRPSGESGKVFLRPADKSVPYGRPLAGKGDRCEVGAFSVPKEPKKVIQVPEKGASTKIGGQAEEESSATEDPN